MKSIRLAKIVDLSILGNRSVLCRFPGSGATIRLLAHIKS